MVWWASACLTIASKGARTSVFFPMPHPMIIEWRDSFHFLNKAKVSSESPTLASVDELRIGWTIISGEYDLIGIAAYLVQKIWEMLPPPFSAEIAAK